MIACPTCGMNTTVIETRESSTYIRRRRRCVGVKCGARVTTAEFVLPFPLKRPIADDLVIVRRGWLDKLKEIVGVIVADPSIFSSEPGDDYKDTDNGHG